MIEFIEIEGKPDAAKRGEIEEFYASIFEKIDREKFRKRIREAENLHIVLALRQNKIIGFKIGYKIAPKKFYSWLGGVDAQFRQQGIAAELMKRQHDRCAANVFETIQTKTYSTNRSMLILNLKSGFDVVGIYENAQNERKIILEKNLL